MRVLCVFGTRPEAIKMAPVVHALAGDARFQPIVCVTGQHRQMLDEVMDVFDLVADVDLSLMKTDQSLCDIASGVLTGVDRLIVSRQPDFVLVQGDTTSAMAASLAAFYRRVKIGHVEAGLRTGNLQSPWPEEANRRLTAVVADLHFAPTQRARDELTREGVPESRCLVTGNTVIDALKHTVATLDSDTAVRAALEHEFSWIDPTKRLIVVTGHRRESFGEGFKHICEAIRSVAHRGDVEIVYPVHLNPNVQGPVNSILAGVSGVHLIPPVDYRRFVYLMTRCHLILTDSGGIQEEAPALRKPVLVMRDTSERMEAVEAGVARLVTTDQKVIVRSVCELLDDDRRYATMACGASPFGDGHAAARIVEALADWR
jgi:UDP-N-acetylglucosamine 2-epimerase